MKSHAGLPREAGEPTRIAGSERKSLMGAWLAVGLFIGGFFFVGAHMPFFLRPGVPNPLAGILAAVVVLLSARAIWETLRWRRFGDPTLEISRAPVPLGGIVEGRVALKAGLVAGPAFSLKLQCIRRVLRQGPKNNHWEESVLWSGDDAAALLPGGLVPVAIAVPPDQPETDSHDAFDRILWRLTVSAPFRGPAFLERYEIPVAGRTEVAEKSARTHAVASPETERKRIVRATRPLLVVGVAILAGGFYLLAPGLGDLLKAAASPGWPTVPGVVRNCLPPGRGAVFVSRTKADFAYAYAVNGIGYTGHVISPHLFWRWQAALRQAQSHPVGLPVTVHYSPKDPANACLEPGLNAGVFQRLLLALVVLTFGFVFALSGVLGPRDADIDRGSVMFRGGTMGSRLTGWAFLALVMEVLGVWWVS